MDKASGTVLDFFTTVEDPRQRGKVLYRLDEILLIALAGCLPGADNMVEHGGLGADEGFAFDPAVRARRAETISSADDVINADPGNLQEALRKPGSGRSRSMRWDASASMQSRS